MHDIVQGDASNISDQADAVEMEELGEDLSTGEVKSTYLNMHVTEEDVDGYQQQTDSQERRTDSQPSKIVPTHTTSETIGTDSNHMQRIELFKPPMSGKNNALDNQEVEC